MCIQRISMILAFCCLLGLSIVAGCEAMDNAMAHVGQAGQVAHQTAVDPQAPLTPDMRTVLEGLGLGAAGLVNFYQSIRYGKLKKTATAIVRGVDDASPEQAAPVKAKIERRMEKAGNFEKLNKVVDQLKPKRKRAA